MSCSTLSSRKGETCKSLPLSFLGLHELTRDSIDTANNYQQGQSEEWIGEWMQLRNNRDQMVIATKYTSGCDPSARNKINTQGNGAKSLKISFEASLRRLRTTYVDVLYLHWWDYTTTVEEVMLSLNHLIANGSVLHLGVSVRTLSFTSPALSDAIQQDTPAWIVSDCNRFAKDRGLSPFVIYQGKFNILERDFERDIIPMARAHGMALAPWSAIGGGKFQSAKDVAARATSGEKGRSMYGDSQSPAQVQISAALDTVAQEIGPHASVTAVALAYVLQAAPYCFPIVGGRKPEQLLANIESLNIHLTAQQIAFLEGTTPFDIGFPSNFIGPDPATNGGKTNFLMQMNGPLAFVQAPKAIGHHSTSQ